MFGIERLFNLFGLAATEQQSIGAHGEPVPQEEPASPHVRIGGIIFGAIALSALLRGCPDTVVPTVSSTVPAAGATAVSINGDVTAIFSEAMDPLTISPATFSLRSGTGQVAGTLSYSGVTAAFDPTGVLAPNTLHTATIAAGAADLAGNALGSAYVWTFTTGPAPDTTAPQVSQTDPLGGATAVPLNKVIAASFSEAMDASTISTATFFLRQGSTPVAGTVAFSNQTATFSPSTELAPLTQYTATVSSGATDLAGNPLASEFTWTFTTGGLPETTAPSVNSTVPANGRTGVALGGNLAATFSEAMDPSTISTATFTLKQGTTPIPGAVSYAGVTATFNPTSPLAPLTQYTATISSSVMDLAGNPLASGHVWSFTTGVDPDIKSPLVSSIDPARGAAGVPVNKRIAVTFSEAMDPLTISTATFTLHQGATPVAGTVAYTGTTALFTPSANLTPSTSYTATAGIGATDLAGNPLAGEFTWTFTTSATPDTTAPRVSSAVPSRGVTGVALGGNLAVTFSEAMDPLTISTVTFTLNQGTTPIPGVVNYAGVTAVFNPSAALAPNTPYTAAVLMGASDLAGNTLEGDYVWTFTTGESPDTTAPTVSFTVPTNGRTGVALGGNLAVAFSESMDPLTISTITFTLNQGSTSISGVVSHAGVTAVFNPNNRLSPNTIYTASVLMEASDLAGNGLSGDYVWTFTTGAIPDTTAPSVSSTVPSRGVTGVALGGNLAATFSESMAPLTISTVTFTLNQGTTPIPGVVTYAGVTAVFNPNHALSPNSTYTAAVLMEASDLAGNTLVSDYVWTFTTGENLDITAPTVISTDPIDGAIGVPINKNLTATFSEAMNPLTITALTFTLDQGATSISGVVTNSVVTAVFNPNNALSPNTTYTAVVWMEASDLAGNTLAGDYVWTFTTGATPDITAPAVMSTDPIDSAIGVPVNKHIAVTFSEVMDPLTISTATFTLHQGATPVLGSVAYVGNTATFTSYLNAYTTYTASVWMEASDLAGNPLESDFVWSFTTGETVTQEPVNLGSSNRFAILAGSTVSNTGPSNITGDLGVSPGTEVVGFPPGILNGATFTGVASAAGQAKLDLTTAFNEAAGRSTGPVSLPGNLSGLTLFPGLYTNSTSVMLSAGNLTLDAQGDVNAVFLFQMGSTLTTGAATQVVLSGGAKAANVYWQVGTSATLGTNSMFKGNILAQASVTLATGATLEGRALTQTAAVTLDSATITVPAQ